MDSSDQLPFRTYFWSNLNEIIITLKCWFYKKVHSMHLRRLRFYIFLLLSWANMIWCILIPHVKTERFQAFNCKTKFQNQMKIIIYSSILKPNTVYFIFFTLYYIFQKYISINISTSNQHAARNVNTCIQISMHAIIMVYMYFKKKTKSTIEEIDKVLH